MRKSNMLPGIKCKRTISNCTDLTREPNLYERDGQIKKSVSKNNINNRYLTLESSSSKKRENNKKITNSVILHEINMKNYMVLS